MCTGVALVLIPFYLGRYPPLAAADLTPTSLEAYHYRLFDDALEIESVDRRYHAARPFWQPEVENTELHRALASNTLLTLWLHRNAIFGLDVGGLTVPKSAGIRDYMRNRRWFFWLIALFLGLGAWGISGGLWLAAQTPEAEDPAESLQAPESDARNESSAGRTASG